MVFGHFWRQKYENTQTLHNLCLYFARQDGQDGKKQKENHATKVTKILKNKRQKYGMNETLTSERKLLTQFMNAPFSLTGIVFLTDDPCHLANFNLRSFLYSTGETKITRL